MGNRAVITASKSDDVQTSPDVGIYVHWNGGRSSIAAFLAYCKLKKYRSPDTDSYGYARLTQVIGNFFGGELSVGVDQCCNLDCGGDNGTYIVENWEIVGRQNFEGEEDVSHPMMDMLLSINEAMPVKEQLAKEVIDAYVASLGPVQVKEEDVSDPSA